MIGKACKSSRLARMGLVLVASVLLNAAAVNRANAQSGQDEAEVHVWPVRENIYMLIGAGGNITASVGPDGVLLVDSGTEHMSSEVLKAIAQLQDQLTRSGALAVLLPERGGAETRSRMPINTYAPPKPIRYVINTHVHPDHTGGNEKLAESGVTYTGGNVAGNIEDAAVGAAILAHENVLVRMLGGEPPVPFGMLPTETYFTDEMKLSTFFNGEGVRLVHMPAAHTDGDTLVYFRGADVISTGDIFSMDTYPVMDIDRGGHVNGIIDALNYILRLAIPEFRTEGGTMMIPGHGRLADSADVAYYRDMVTIIRDRVQHMIDEGMTLRQVQAARPTFGYDGRFGSDTGHWTTEMFVEAVYHSLSEDRRHVRADEEFD